MAMSGWLGYSLAALSIIGLFILILILLFVFNRIRNHLELEPSNDRSWVNDNARTARAEFDGDFVTVYNVRDFNWRTTRDYDERWINQKYDLRTVNKIWLVLEYFEPNRPEMAHTILSFEFEDGRRLACSIEVRREVGEKYHPVKGLLRQYELIYVWATEADVISVRTRCRKRSVTHLFEGIVLGENNHRRLLESYLRRTNDLASTPEWYNTFTNTCTTNIARHVNEVYPGRVPRALAILMPGLSPKMLERRNLIRIEGDLSQTLANSIIDERALTWEEGNDFGDWIRTNDSESQDR